MSVTTGDNSLATQQMSFVLNQLLSTAEVRIAGRTVACRIIDTDGKHYDGVTVGGKDPKHAEEVALMKMGVSPISEVHLMSSAWRERGVKFAIPCITCMRELANRAVPGCELVLYAHEASSGGSWRFDLETLAGSYLPQEEEVVPVDGLNTLLNVNDAVMVESFMEAVQTESPEARFYLTGLAAGRNTARSEVARAMRLDAEYSDVDMVVIVPGKDKQKPRHIVSDAFNATALAMGISKTCIRFAATVAGDPSLKDISSEGLLMFRTYWFEGPDLPAISPLVVCVGNSLEEVLTRDYYDYHWYVEVSKKLAAV